MRAKLLDILRCPNCGGALELRDADEADGEIRQGTLVCEKCSGEFPIVDSIPRFVPAENYAGNFGMQWNMFRQTQLDSFTGHPISRDRFFSQSHWSAEQLEGKRVLDVGCGAGRFTEIALSTGAHVVAMDYSSAVDACYANHSSCDRLSVVQADIYHLPFAPEAFDYVYCFGVLQHTPDVRASFMALPAMLHPGGHLAIDCYPGTPVNFLWPKYWLRPLTKRMDAERLFGLCKWMVRWLLPVSELVRRIPLVGRKLRYGVPVVNYRGVLPLNDAQQRDWSLLDTFDMLAPAHDHPKSLDTIRGWFDEAGLREIEVDRPGLVVGRAVR
jgi:SAM-dependent methyltransferase